MAQSAIRNQDTVHKGMHHICPQVSRVASSWLGSVILCAEVGEGQLVCAALHVLIMIDLDRWWPQRAIQRRDVLSLNMLPHC